MPQRVSAYDDRHVLIVALGASVSVNTIMRSLVYRMVGRLGFFRSFGSSLRWHDIVGVRNSVRLIATLNIMISFASSPEYV